MFTQRKFYDLNIRTDAKRKQEMAHAEKHLRASFNYPTVVEPSRNMSSAPQMGTPASAMSLKQRQQKINYEFKYGEQM
jgi:hypothetical protein